MQQSPLENPLFGGPKSSTSDTHYSATRRPPLKRNTSTKDKHSELPDTTTMTTHSVYSVSYRGLPAYHEATYVEMDDEGGIMYHVIGDNLPGFRFQKKHTKRPEDSQSFSKKVEKGKVNHEDLAKLNSICRNVPPPSHTEIGGVTVKQDC